MDDSQIGDGAGNAVDEAKDRIDGAARTGSELAAKARTAAAGAGRAIQNAAVGAAKQIGDAAAGTYRQGVRVSKSLSQNTAEQPFPALLIAGAIGFGIAYLIYRSKGMAVEQKKLYNSPNGDKWFLVRDPATGEVFVRHEPNAPSGGRSTDIEIGEFLGAGPRNPEHRALLDLIGTLIEGGREQSRST